MALFNATIGVFLCFIGAVTFANQSADSILNTLVPNGTVLSMAHDKANNALYIAGRFAGFGVKTGGGAILDHSGKLIQQPPVFNGRTFASISDGNGGFYVGGDFSDVNATGIKHIAHVNGDGTIDSQFKPIVNAAVKHFSMIAGQLYAASDRNVVEIDIRSGVVNPAFSLSTDNIITAMHVTNFGVYIGGIFHHVNGMAIAHFAKASRNTGVVDAHYYRASSMVSQILSRPNDELFLVMNAINERIIKLHEIAGTVNSNFNVGRIRQAAIDAAIDGNWLYVSFSNLPFLRRYNIFSGALDIGFPVRLNKAPKIIGFDGQYLYMSGGFTLINGSSAVKYFARLDKTSWQLDKTYHQIFLHRPVTMTVDNDKVFVGGYFIGVGKQGPSYLAKIDLTTGLLDPSFSPKINSYVDAIALNNDRLFIGGEFSAIDDQPAQHIAMLSTAGVVDGSFVPHADGNVYVLKKHRGYLYAGGTFRHMGGRTARFLTRFKLATLTQDTTFDFGQDNAVWDVAFSGKYLFVGGEFTNKLNEYSLDTGIKLPQFKPIINGTVKRLLFDVDHLYATGYFPQVIVRLNPRTGAGRPKFKPTLHTRGFALAKYGNYIYVGTDQGLVRLDSITGESDTDFQSHADDIVYNLLTDGNRLFMAGYYWHIFDKFVPYISDTVLQ